MPITVIVLYPQTPDLQLNIQSFLEDHAPRVLRVMGPYGLRAVRAVVLHGSPITQNTDKEYALQVAQDWDTLAAFQEAYEATSKELMAHISTFSNKQPLIMYGDIVLNKKQ